MSAGLICQIQGGWLITSCMQAAASSVGVITTGSSSQPDNSSSLNRDEEGICPDMTSKRITSLSPTFVYKMGVAQRGDSFFAGDSSLVAVYLSVGRRGFTPHKATNQNHHSRISNLPNNSDTQLNLCPDMSLSEACEIGLVEAVWTDLIEGGAHAGAAYKNASLHTCQPIRKN